MTEHAKVTGMNISAMAARHRGLHGIHKVTIKK